MFCELHELLMKALFGIIIDIRDVGDRLDGDRPVSLLMSLVYKVIVRIFHCSVLAPGPFDYISQNSAQEANGSSSTSIMTCSQLYKEIKQFEKFGG